MKELNKTESSIIHAIMELFFYNKKTEFDLNSVLAPRVGLEPTTFRLTAERSTD